MYTRAETRVFAERSNVGNKWLVIKTAPVFRYYPERGLLRDAARPP